MSEKRKLVWFSCGAASAVTAKMVVDASEDEQVEVIYCDTFAYEHPDNRRFFNDVQAWIDQDIKILQSDKYKDIYDVFEKTKWLVGKEGARCTTELKKKLRFEYQHPDDIHCFGYTKEEKHRIDRMKENNPEIYLEFPLFNKDISKRECLLMLQDAGIELPAMYKLGYKNNNCIGCVKGGAGYWNKIRVDFPEHFKRMAKLERKLNVAINKRYEEGERIKVFLDELNPNAGRYPSEPDISCGVQCSLDFGEENQTP